MLRQCPCPEPVRRDGRGGAVRAQAHLRAQRQRHCRPQRQGDERE